jgi:hypothetical protein
VVKIPSVSVGVVDVLVDVDNSSAETDDVIAEVVDDVVEVVVVDVVVFLSMWGQEILKALVPTPLSEAETNAGILSLKG